MIDLNPWNSEVSEGSPLPLRILDYQSFRTVVSGFVRPGVHIVANTARAQREKYRAARKQRRYGTRSHLRTDRRFQCPLSQARLPSLAAELPV
jgi:hypothetical protein